jgi:hypothetical protein
MANEQAFLIVWGNLHVYTQLERRGCLFAIMNCNEHYWEELKTRVRAGVASGALSLHQSFLFDHILDARRWYKGNYSYIHNAYDDVIDAHITILGQILTALNMS